MILKARLMKRLQKIKKFIGTSTTRDEIKKKVKIDNLKAEYAGVGKKDHLIFEFEIKNDNLQSIKFPIQYEGSGNFQDFKFEIGIRSNFDDLTYHEEIPHSDLEEIGYKSN